MPASSNELWVRVEELEEKVDEGAAAEQRLLLLRRAVERHVIARQIEQALDFGDRKGVDAKKMAGEENWAVVAGMH